MADRDAPMGDDQLSTVLRVLADGTFAGYAPTYERIARAWADDAEAMDVVRELDRPSKLPIRVLAAVRDLTLSEPDLPLAAIYRGAPGDPWPAFRRVLVERLADIEARVRRRAVQTNEVGRSAVLLPMIAWVADQFPGRPIALIEIGPSAGLNLAFDRYHVTYSDGRTSGDPASPVHLHCDVRGPVAPPLPDVAPAIVSRVGLDVAPLDPTDPDDARWLEACVWPDLPDRVARLRAALALARSDPPTLRRGDALELLGPAIDEVTAPTLPVVFATWALAYLSTEGRQRVHDLVAERGHTRDIALLTAEHALVTPWIDAARPPEVDESTDGTVVGASVWHAGAEHRQAIAWMHPHGGWLAWQADPALEVVP